MYLKPADFYGFKMSGVRAYELGCILVISLWCSFLFAGAKVVTDPSEVSALQVIRSNFVDARNLLNSWNTGDPCTLPWRGVSCSNVTGDDGYMHVHELLLLSMNLSGSLAPDIGHLSQLRILDVMWNKISGNIPKEIGNIKSLELLLLSGNQLSGSLPEEIGYLPNLNRLQIDENYISGPLPVSFANLINIRHLHMNNNSISGQLPAELSRLSTLIHILLDNNNLSGSLPKELSSMPSLTILQLDNNPFHGSAIPDSYGNMSRLLKLSLRNCSLQGSIPDLSRAPHLLYLDLSWNQLTGFIPSNKLADNITTINLSNNNLSGAIPPSFSGLPLLQRLSLENNMLSGTVPSTIWLNMTYNATSRLTLDFENNLLSNTAGVLNPPANVTIRLRGNPVCMNASHLNIVQFCEPQTGGTDPPSSSENSTTVYCPPTCPTDFFYEYVPKSLVPCFCAAPIRVGYRLKSPSFSYFRPYISSFESFLSSDLNLYPDQLFIDSYIWEEGPRLRMYLKFFPHYSPNTSRFNTSEIVRIEGMFVRWKIPLSDFYGPYELLNFTLIGPYENVILDSTKSGISKGALVGIVLAAVVFAVSVSSCIAVFVTRRHSRYHHAVSRKRQLSQIPIKIDGVKGFTFGELALAANNFSNSTQVGQGGYGKVYKGILSDGTIVAIKRAEEGSLQGRKEFLTEIELLSRLHHRNLVSLVGYCDEEGEQMLVYEFMPNGTLRDHLSGKLKEPLSFSMRLSIALGSAKGILYLHSEADPPIFHRDIKASNILLDLKLTAKVADFGLSRLAPVPGIEGDVPGHVSTVVKGTPGYLDPEYFLTHKLTDKSDVYSLGVVFLELLTNMRPIMHGKNIVREVNAACESGMVFSVIDKDMGSYSSNCVEKFMTFALRCCQDDPNMRPSMSEVVREIESIKRMMPESEAPPSGSMTIDFKTVSTLPSSASLSMNPDTFASSISGSDLLSNTMPTLTPR